MNLKFACIAVVLGLAASLPVNAALGSNEVSVSTDGAHLGGKVRVTRMEQYNLHEIQAATGALIREYVSPSGTVFAVTFQSPSVPDMRQLLGSYYEPYVQAAQSRKARRGPVSVQLPGLVVEVSGHMRAFFGRAYDPQLLPSGVRAEQIR